MWTLCQEEQLQVVSAKMISVNINSVYYEEIINTNIPRPYGGHPDTTGWRMGAG